MRKATYAYFTSALLCSTLILASGLPSRAVSSDWHSDLYEIRLPDFGARAKRSFASEQGMRSAASAVASRYGGNWRAYGWNPYTSTAVYLYGTGFATGRSIVGTAELEAMAREVIAANPEVFKAGNEELRLVSTPHAAGRWVAHFQQIVGGLDIKGARARVAFTESGRLVLLGSECFGDPAVDTRPSITAAVAEALATSSLPFNPMTDTVMAAPKLVVLPVPESETQAHLRLGWSLKIRTADPFGVWAMIVDARTGEILSRLNELCLDYLGTTESDAHCFNYCDGDPFAQPMPHLNITVGGVGTTTSNASGEWFIEGGSGIRMVSCYLQGPYVQVFNYNGAEAFFSETTAAGVPFTVDLNAANSRQDERDVFDAVNDIHDFFDLFDPEFGYTNATITANVNRTDGLCPGAWWDGVAINFCAPGGGRVNTGELQQVVHHEYGHGVQHYILGSQGNEGLGEGNADFLGNLITQDHVVARGINQDVCESGLRDSQNTLIYPDDVVGQEIHYAGQVIAGFNWDAMALLQERYGQSEGTVMSAYRWHYARVLLEPLYQPDQVFATFFVDDDNGNMDDGTPHLAIFCEAATNHNFECPEIMANVLITHTPHSYTMGVHDDYDLQATVISLAGGVIQPNTVAIQYRIDGGVFTQIGMAAGGGPDVFTGSIPAQPWNSVVEYYLSAQDDLGNTGTSPADAPAGLHYFQVNEDFTEELEDDTAWTDGISGDTATSGVWERADPVGTVYNGEPVQPENDHTPDPGTDCFVTGNGIPGDGATVNDVDGGRTTLLSPVFDVTGAQEVDIGYWRWYTNDLGINPGEDLWLVDISNDGGITWTAIESTDASNNTWQRIGFDLFDHFAEAGRVQLRFIAEDRFGGSLVEAAVDDFVLLALVDATGVDGELPVHITTDLSQNLPNPFNPKTEIRFSLEAAGEVSLKVYDARGRLVRALAEGYLAAGEHKVNWDGTDSQGRSLASGMYFYKLEADGPTLGKRMVLVK